jgi:thioredoxin-related protein
MRMFVTTVLVMLTMMLLVVACTSAAASTSGTKPMTAPAGIASGEWLEDYQLALKRAATEKKPILAVFSGSDWCGGCIELKRVVFDTPEFSAWAEEHVVLLELDFPNDKPQSSELKEQNSQLYTSLGVSQFPAVMFLDASGKKIGQMDQIPLPTQPWIDAASSILGQ